MYKFSFGIFALLLIGCSRPITEQNVVSDQVDDRASKTTPTSTTTTSNQTLEQRDRSGATPLMLATRANDIAKAKMLIDAGADVNAKDHIQDSPYLYAGARGHLEILNMTLEHGADLKSTNRYGGTALIPAAERGHVETVKRLIKAGVDVNHVNRLGWTALLEAVMLGDGSAKYQKIVEALIQADADVNFKDPKSVSILQHAQQRGYHEIATLLTEAGAK